MEQPLSDEVERQPWNQEFKVRPHDLDPGGRLSLVAMLRLAEAHRWDVLRGDLAGAFTRVVVRSQGLEMEGEAGYGDRLSCCMWVSRVGTTSVTFASEAVGADGRVIARGSTTLVATDEAGAPTPIGPGVAARRIDRPALEVPRRTWRRPSGTAAHALTVQHHDLDLLQHVNQARYGDYVLSARDAIARSGGYGDFGRAADRPGALELSYEGEARLGDELRIHSWALDERSLAFEVVRARDDATVTLAAVRA